MDKQGILVVLSGFSGAGKGTIMKALLERHDDYALSISATTRKPRAGEVEGREYFFVSKEQFLSMVEEDALIEHAQYVDNYYGTPKRYVEEQRAAGKDVILEIEIQGALKIKEKFPDALLIFVMPPDAAELERRLTGRGTESPEAVRARLKRAAEEAVGVEAYDYILVNDQLDTCVEELHQMIQVQHSRTSARIAMISKMRQELSRLG
ncbi:MAG: guanylate kinase [Lachnospiraceae bacterium]|nr:guanylate kinase [Lachnospiraceae bacterium]